MWQDLRLHVTMQDYFALKSVQCAKKTVIYGRDAVHYYPKEDSIGILDYYQQQQGSFSHYDQYTHEHHLPLPLGPIQSH